MKIKVLGVVARLLVVLAAMSAGGASFWISYQPSVPKALER